MGSACCRKGVGQSGVCGRILYRDRDWDATGSARGEAMVSTCCTTGSEERHVEVGRVEE